MSYLSQFGIAVQGNNLQEFAMSIDVTDEIAEHLVEQGIDLSIVNKLQIPSGFTSVGKITILCHLPTDLDWRDSDIQLWAIVGAVKWKLSKNYRIHRVFAQPISADSEEERQTLAVLSVDDWRYDLNLTGSNNTTDNPQNEYANDFSIVGESATSEIEGVQPYDLASLDWEKLHLFYDLNWTPSLENAFNAWGYEREMSDAELADRVLTACGLVAVPQPILRDEATEEIQYSNEYLYGSDISGNQQPSPNPYNPEEHYMVAEYIGDGHICATQLWENLHSFYKSGQLECAYGTPERNDTSFGVDDDMSMVLDEVPQQPNVGQNVWIARAEDGNQEIPATIDVTFPAKTAEGRFMMYRVSNLEHGKPSTAINGYSFTAQYKTLTDHVKTVSTHEGYEEDGSKLFIVDIDPDSYEPSIGITQERQDELLQRALHLSRCYYARYYACSGNVMFVGWHHARAIPGCTFLEYGFTNGVPYTSLSGTKHHKLFGFSTTDFSNNSVVFGGGLLLNRPDGQSEIVTGGTASNNLLCKVTNVAMSPGGCVASSYSLERLSDGVEFIDVVPTDRVVPDMCYEPITEDTLVLFAYVPKEDDEEPSCDQDGCNYLFIACEEVQTVECT